MWTMGCCWIWTPNNTDYNQCYSESKFNLTEHVRTLLRTLKWNRLRTHPQCSALCIECRCSGARTLSVLRASWARTPDACSKGVIAWTPGRILAVKQIQNTKKAFQTTPQNAYCSWRKYWYLFIYWTFDPMKDGASSNLLNHKYSSWNCSKVTKGWMNDKLLYMQR